MPLKKLAPGTSTPSYVKKFLVLIEKQYPALLKERAGLTPIITVLFAHDGAIERSDMEMYSGALESFKASESQFARFGLARDEVGLVGVQGIQAEGNQILVVFTDRKDSNKPYVPSVFPDSREIDVPQRIARLVQHRTER